MSSAFCTLPRLLAFTCLTGRALSPSLQAMPLFNGHDLTGWSIQSHGQFSVANGVLTVNRGNGWLRSDTTFADAVFILEFRFLEKGANSGIFVRTEPTSANDERGHPDYAYQVQCMDANTGSRPLGQIIVTGFPAVQSQLNREALQRAYRPALEWNTLEITCRGETIAVKLNDVSITTATGLKSPRGHLGIQGELGLLEFRRIEVMPLKIAEPQR